MLLSEEMIARNFLSPFLFFLLSLFFSTVALSLPPLSKTLIELSMIILSSLSLRGRSVRVNDCVH